MSDKEFLKCKKNYDIARHHAWAGTALLSVLMAMRYIFAVVPQSLIVLLGSVLIIYILVALAFTFKYRAGLRAETQWTGSGREAVKGEMPVVAEKVESKLEKKRAKAEAKTEKKRQINNKEAL
jgi:hypothetical protein